MKKTAALVEFTLTTAMLAFWAIACAAAFNATGSSTASSGPNGAAGQAETVSVAASQQALPPVAVSVEAALDVAPRDPAAAERI